MKKTKIDWCDCTLNPVVGCPRGCKYCYARKLNDRFHFVDDWSKPQFFPERLEQLDSKNPKSVFMDSMSDFAFWKDEWKEITYKAMNKNPQHSYIFLTKHEEIKRPYYAMANNIYWGRTFTNGTWFNGFNDEYFNFLSIEPILGNVEFNSFGSIRQVIIGAETGNRKDKVIPKKEWITDIVKQCDEFGIRVFMKESLRKIMGDDFRQDKLIWSVD